MSNDLTIKQAKDAMRLDLHKGTKCLCCGQPVKMYRRPLTSSMAYGLILLWKETIRLGSLRLEQWIHLETFFKEQDVAPSIRADIPKLRFWGLIMPKTGTKREDGNPNNGYYKLTSIGNQFVEGNVKVSSHIQVYNNEYYGFPKNAKDIYIKQALKNKFNYEEVVKL